MNNSVTATQTATQVSQTSSTTAGSSWEAFIPFILIFVLFYFLIIRPQQKREAQKKEQLGKIKRGDRILTNGGITAVVTKVIDDKKIMIEIAPKVEVEFHKGFITDVINKKESKKDIQPVSVSKTESMKAEKVSESESKSEEK